MESSQLSGGNPNSIGDPCKFGIVTISDRAAAGTYEDQGGPAICQFFQQVVDSPWTAHYELIPDRLTVIERTLIYMADTLQCDLIITTGGTGPAPRDVTPEATRLVSDKVLDGFGEFMRNVSLKYVPTAILSRQMAVIRGKSVIVNLPGRPKAIRETLDDVWGAIPYCIDLAGGGYVESKAGMVQGFRPKDARRLRV